MTAAFAITGSFCTVEAAFGAMEALLADGWKLIPVFSETAAGTDTRFGRAEEFVARAEMLCACRAIRTISEAESLGPKSLAQAMVIAPCTGNTMAKLSRGITDSAVTMGAKSLLRNGCPVLIAPATNDGLGAGAENIGRLLARKHIFFVPFRQDDPIKKPRSVASDYSAIPHALLEAMEDRQIQPILASCKAGADMLP